MSSSQIIVLVVGALSIISGILKLGVNGRKNAFLIKIIGETGYRIFSILIGLVLIYMALFSDMFT